MQNFYSKLCASPANQATYLSFLSRLTQASRTKIRALPNSMGWGNWGL